MRLFGAYWSVCSLSSNRAFSAEGHLGLGRGSLGSVYVSVVSV